MSKAACGHKARSGIGTMLICDLAEGHRGLHAMSVQLRRSNGDGTYTETTNWGDDGNGAHATSGRQGEQ